MKYFFVFLAILSFVVKELFIITKKDEDGTKQNKGFKKLNPLGWFLFTIGLIGLLYSTYEAEKKLINDKIKAEQKITLDSIRYATTIENQDSMISLDKKVQSITEDMNTFLEDEVSRLKTQLKKQEQLSLKAQYPIPEYFYVDFWLVFDIEENNLQEYEAIIKFRLRSLPQTYTG